MEESRPRIFCGYLVLRKAVLRRKARLSLRQNQEHCHSSVSANFSFWSSLFFLRLLNCASSNSTFTLFDYHSPSNFSRKEAKIAKIGAELI
ncbi:MAG: hypothetical protein FWG66_00885, partial [Spirochaetes bacterium]|nr:hypothetical protein [Spirochaetota bacterium]